MKETIFRGGNTQQSFHLKDTCLARADDLSGLVALVDANALPWRVEDLPARIHESVKTRKERVQAAIAETTAASAAASDVAKSG